LEIIDFASRDIVIQCSAAAAKHAFARWVGAARAILAHSAAAFSYSDDEPIEPSSTRSEALNRAAERNRHASHDAKVLDGAPLARVARPLAFS
jgi:hypothetical protein